MKSALLVIDVQESFRQRPTWAEMSDPDIVTTTNRVTDWARSVDVPVLWVLHSEPNTATPFDPALGHVALIDGVVADDAEPVFVKTSRNAFTTTNLGQYLTANGIGRLIITGIQTEQCCETTARLAADLGFDVEFVLDATATFPIAHLTTDEIIERTRYALEGRFATITDVATLVAAGAAAP